MKGHAMCHMVRQSGGTMAEEGEEVPARQSSVCHVPMWCVEALTCHSGQQRDHCAGRVGNVMAASDGYLSRRCGCVDKAGQQGGHLKVDERGGGAVDGNARTRRRRRIRVSAQCGGVTGHTAHGTTWYGGVAVPNDDVDKMHACEGWRRMKGVHAMEHH